MRCLEKGDGGCTPHTHAHIHIHSRPSIPTFRTVVNEGFNTAVVQGRVLEFESAERFRELEFRESNFDTHRPRRKSILSRSGIRLTRVAPIKN